MAHLSHFLFTHIVKAHENLAYPHLIHPTAQISRIYLMASLAGHQPPHPAQAKVLEIGCAYGDNLAASAEFFPKASFLGVDIDEQAISKGKEIIELAQLKNIELKVVTDLKKDLGERKFDYIIAHGLISWISPDAQNQVMKFCSESLTSKGCFYVSYNCFPGWLHKNAALDLLSDHLESSPKKESIKILRNQFNLLKNACCSWQAPSSFNSFFGEQLESIEGCDDGYLFGELCAENNDPFYYSEFIQWANEFGLSDLADADPMRELLESLPQESLKYIQQFSDNAILQRQAADFVMNTSFRSSILYPQKSASGNLAEHKDDAFMNCAFSFTKIVLNLEDTPKGTKVTLQGEKTFIAPLNSRSLLDALSQSFSVTARDFKEKENTISFLKTLLSAGLIYPVMPQNKQTPLNDQTPCISPLNRALAKKGWRIFNYHFECAEPPLKNLIEEMDGKQNCAQIAQKVGKEEKEIKDAISQMKSKGFMQWH